MARGGARNRSGPQPDPNSGRSEARGYALTALPAEGYDGPVPSWPLAKLDVWVSEKVDGTVFRERDGAAEDAIEARELFLWETVWKTPQACAWSMPSESWRLMTIAMYVRVFTLCESSRATATDRASLHRFADQIGLTPAGLKENGWQIAKNELAEYSADADYGDAPKRPFSGSSRDRMKVVSDGHAAG